MKKIINTIAIIFFSVFAVSVASAQHGGHRGGGARGGEHSSFGGGGHNMSRGNVSHSFAQSRSVAAYRGVNYNRGAIAYGHSYNRGGVVYSHGYNRGGVVYGRGGYYGHSGFAGRRAFVPWGAAHRYAYARPVYFPRYHLYYDPLRCGYTYWYGGRWLFSSVLPSIFAGIDFAAQQMAYAASVPQPYYPNSPYDDGGYDDGY